MCGEPPVASAIIPARGRPIVCPIETPRVRWPNFAVSREAGKLCGMSAWEATVVSTPKPRLIVATRSTPRLGATAASATGAIERTVPTQSTAVAYPRSTRRPTKSAVSRGTSE